MTGSLGPRSAGRLGVEDDLARGRAGRGVQAPRGDLVARVRVEHRVQELVELLRVDPGNRLLPGDQPLLDHRDRRLQRRGGRALRRARLEQVERALLDRELDVLDVAVVPLERGHRLDQLRERLREALAPSARAARACGSRRRRPRPAR